MTLLEEAAEVVKIRRLVYAPPYKQHKIAADLFNAWKGTELTAADAAMFMMMIKISRLAQTPNHLDTILDIAGYTDVYNECIKNSPTFLDNVEEAELDAVHSGPWNEFNG